MSAWFAGLLAEAALFLADATWFCVLLVVATAIAGIAFVGGSTKLERAIVPMLIGFFLLGLSVTFAVIAANVATAQLEQQPDALPLISSAHLGNTSQAT